MGSVINVVVREGDKGKRRGFDSLLYRLSSFPLIFGKYVYYEGNGKWEEKCSRNRGRSRCEGEDRERVRERKTQF